MSEVALGSFITTELKFSWEIPNFSSVHAKTGVGKALYSPKFNTTFCHKSSDKISNLFWRMRLYPSGCTKNTNGKYVSVCLENLDAIEVSAIFTVALVDKLNNKVFFSHTGEAKFGEQKLRGWPDFARKNAVIECLANDTVTISCSVIPKYVVCNHQDSDQQGFSIDGLMNHFGNLFNTGKFSDVTFVVGDRKINAHRSVVSYSSPVFQKKFENQMKEQNPNVIEITDMKFDIAKEMLRYMYTKKVNGIEKVASDLFVAAIKYRVEGLTILCKKVLSRNSDKSDTLDCFKVATENNKNELKLKNNDRDGFENLLETGKFSDVTFYIGKKSLQLHKAILSSESEVFRAMFDHEMKEQKDNIVEIVDIDFDVMKELFRYIYAKKVNGIEKIAADLLVAADKYCLTGLKELCDENLCKRLSANNVLQYLELAVNYNAEKLKSKTVKLVLMKLKNFVKKKEFQALSHDCKNELFISMANNQ